MRCPLPETARSLYFFPLAYPVASTFTASPSIRKGSFFPSLVSPGLPVPSGLSGSGFHARHPMRIPLRELSNMRKRKHRYRSPLALWNSYLVPKMVLHQSDILRFLIVNSAFAAVHKTSSCFHARQKSQPTGMAMLWFRQKSAIVDAFLPSCFPIRCSDAWRYLCISQSIIS